MMRNRLQSESDGFDDEISQTLTFPVSSYDVGKEAASRENTMQFENIEDALEGMFEDCYTQGSRHSVY